MKPATLFRWQVLTLFLLFLGYAGYYLCRSVLSVSNPLLLAEYGPVGWTKEDLGLVGSLGTFWYALGKTVNGLAVDRLGGRLLFVLGMVVSAGCVLLFGLASGLLAFCLIWSVNRYVQSVGWGGVVQVASRWYPASVRATVMGALSMSYLLGDAGARGYLAIFLAWGVDWRGLFFIAAGTLGVLAVITLLGLRSSPRVLGGEEPDEGPLAIQVGTDAAPSGLEGILLALLARPAFWVICGLSVGLTLLRETLTFWTSTLLHEVVGMNATHAAAWGLILPLAGAAGALVGGMISDRTGGRHDWVMVPSLAALAGLLLLMARLPLQGEGALAVLLIGLTGFVLLMPYSFLAGTMALDLGGKQGVATAAGLIDTAGYLGGTLSGYGVGVLAHRYGWPVTFAVLAVVAALSGLLAVGYGVLRIRRAAMQVSGAT